MKNMSPEEFNSFCEQLDNVIQSQTLKAEPRHLLTKKIKLESYFELNSCLLLFDHKSPPGFNIFIEVYRDLDIHKNKHVFVYVESNTSGFRLEPTYVLDNINKLFTESIKNFILFNLDLFN